MYRSVALLLALLLASLGAGCSSTTDCIPSGNTATYQVTFTALWSSSTHPNAYPSNAHFSKVVGATHKSAYRIFELGQAASAGVEEMAETGGTSTLQTEIEAQIEAGNACDFILGAGINSPGSTTVSFTVSDDFPLVTLTTMIAPSPDWFIGADAHTFSLKDSDGAWKDSLTLNLNAYDAGTDSGTDFTSSDSDTSPKAAITSISDSDFSSAFGTFLFEKQ